MQPKGSGESAGHGFWRHPPAYAAPQAIHEGGKPSRAPANDIFSIKQAACARCMGAGSYSFSSKSWLATCRDGPSNGFRFNVNAVALPRPGNPPEHQNHSLRRPAASAALACRRAAGRYRHRSLPDLACRPVRPGGHRRHHHHGVDDTGSAGHRAPRQKRRSCASASKWAPAMTCCTSFSAASLIF